MQSFLPGVGSLDIPIASPTPAGDGGPVIPINDGKTKPVAVVSRTNIPVAAAKALPAAEAASEVIRARQELADATAQQQAVVNTEKTKRLLTVLGVGVGAWLLLRN